MSGLNRLIDIGGGGQRRPTDHVTHRRIVHVEEIVGPGFHPPAIDEIVEDLDLGTSRHLGHRRPS